MNGGKKPIVSPFRFWMPNVCEGSKVSFWVIWLLGWFFFFQFILFLLGLADSCLASNSRLCSDGGSKILMDKIVVLHHLENLACKFSPGLELIQA